MEFYLLLHISNNFCFNLLQDGEMSANQTDARGKKLTSVRQKKKQ